MIDRVIYELITSESQEAPGPGVRDQQLELAHQMAAVLLNRRAIMEGGRLTQVQTGKCCGCHKVLPAARVRN